jgi:hypothetical protein
MTMTEAIAAAARDGCKTIGTSAGRMPLTKFKPGDVSTLWWTYRRADKPDGRRGEIMDEPPGWPFSSVYPVYETPV